MEKKNGQITAIVGKNHVFLLGNCDLAAQTRPDHWWMGSPPLAPAPVMEGSSWHRVAAEQGARLRPNMKQGKVYLYQLYTTCFAEFDTLEQAQAFRQQIGEADPYWDYDPVATIDTNNPDTVQRWAEFMEGD